MPREIQKTRQSTKQKRARRKLLPSWLTGGRVVVRVARLAAQRVELYEVPEDASVAGVQLSGEEPLAGVPRLPDPYVTPYHAEYKSLRNLEQPSGQRRAEDVASRAAEKNRVAVLIVRGSKNVSPQAIESAAAIARRAGLTEITLYVEDARRRP